MKLLVFRSLVLVLLVSISLKYQRSPLYAQSGNTGSPSLLTAPTNLRVNGLLSKGKSTDTLQWAPSPNALKYNIYSYNNYGKSNTGDFRTPIALGVTKTIYTLPAERFVAGITYTVTAVMVVDGVEYESLASAVAGAQGVPAYWDAPPDSPTNLKGEAELQDNKPRVLLTWQGDSKSSTYLVYRNGRLIASGVWGLSYIDTTATANKTYSYAVAGVNSNQILDTNGQINGIKPYTSTPSETLKVTVNPSSPSFSTTPISITQIIRNDDSAIIYFAPVSGAKDYRAYILSGPSGGIVHGNATNRVYKYSGGGLSIEVNGLNPVIKNRIILEAVDKFGPFQTMDGEMSPGVNQPDGMTVSHVNGLGDPSNNPQVIARSEPVTLVCKPFTLKGQDAFFDNFRTFDPLVQTSPSLALLAATQTPVYQSENSHWTITNYNGDFASSRTFVASNHFMGTLYDGGTPTGSTPMHNNASSLVMTPKAVADMSNGKVLHVTYEVDSHLSERRWISMYVTPENDELTVPDDEFFSQKFTNGTQSFLCALSSDRCRATVVNEQGRFDESPYSWFYRGDLNGSMADLDHRHRVDIYLSNTHLKVIEDKLDGSPAKILRDAPLPARLDFTRVKVHFTHQFYHSSLERQEDLIHWNPKEQYWINHRPFADERHWDNMGFEVLDTIP